MILMFVFRLCIAIITALVTAVGSLKCGSRFYCKTSEIKYMGMKELQKAYLNTTAISKHTVENKTACQILCNREPKCFSLNINISIAKRYECHVLAENMFSHADRVVANTDFIHLYIESKCSKHPCQNKAICKPFYMNDTYSCQCIRNNSYITTGKHCGKRLPVFETADYYWNFDRFPETVKSGQHPNLPAYSFYTSTPNVYEAGRRSRVATCGTGQKKCARFSSPLPCITTMTDCTTGATWSIWVKLRHPLSRCEILQNYEAGRNTGIALVSAHNIGNGYHFSVYATANRRWYLNGFGKAVDPFKWTHITLTFHQDSGICAYINGNRIACGNSNSAKSASTYLKQFQIGYHWSTGGRCHLYADDFAVWKSVLSEKDVKQMYDESKSEQT